VRVPGHDELAEGRQLLEVDLLQLVQLEQREEVHDDLDAVAAAARQLREARPAAGALELVDDHAGGLAHGHADRLDVRQVDRRLRLLGQRACRELRELGRGDGDRHLGHEPGEALLQGDGPRHVAHVGLEALGHEGRRLLERAVVQQPGVQQVAGLQGDLVQLGVVLARQQARRLQLDQGGGHHQELGRRVEVDRVQVAQDGQVLVGDLRDRDVVDVDLVPRDELQQEVEGPLEGADGDVVRGGHRRRV
jgi:hypothetical protein